MTEREPEAVFRQLYDATYLPAARYVARHCADPAQVPDLLQEVYTDVYDALRRKGADYIREGLPFVLSTAKAKLARYYQRRQREAKVLSLDALLEPDGGGAPREWPDTLSLSVEEGAETQALLARINALVGNEPPETRRIFTLFYGFGLTGREIAGEMHLREATVRSRLHRLTQKLREELRKDGYTV